MKKFLLLPLTLFAMAAGYCPSVLAEKTPPATKPLPLIPGQQAGPLKLGIFLEEAEKLMGKPLMDDASMGFAVQGWKAFGHTVIVRYHRIFKGEKHDGKTLEHDMWFLTQIRITSLQFSTASGIKIGSSLKDIRKQYPGLAAAETRAASPSLVLYDDAKAGIAFEIEVGMKIDGSTWPCGAITVHPPGEAVRSMPQLRD